MGALNPENPDSDNSTPAYHPKPEHGRPARPNDDV